MAYKYSFVTIYAMQINETPCLFPLSLSHSGSFAPSPLCLSLSGVACGQSVIGQAKSTDWLCDIRLPIAANTFHSCLPPLWVSLSPSLYLHNSHPIRSRIAFHRSKFHSGLSFPLNIASITQNEENESYVIICGCKFRRFSQLHNDLIR